MSREEFFAEYFAPGGKLGTVQTIQQRCDSFIRQAAEGIAVYGDCDEHPLLAVPSRGRWILLTRRWTAAPVMPPVPRVPCQAHPTRDAPPATRSYIQGLRVVKVRVIDPDTGEHLADGEVDVAVNDAAFLCDSCFAYTQQPRVREQIEPLIERLHDPSQFVAACSHLVIGVDRSQALACGECNDGGLRCDRCAMEHGLAAHCREDDFHGCAICGEGPLFVPLLLPVGRLDRSVAAERGKAMIHFRGWVWATLRPPKRCVAHINVGAISV